MTYKVWYQSFVSQQQQQSYVHQLEQTLNKFSNSDVIFEVHGIEPPDTDIHPLTEMRCACQAIENALFAQKNNYDAFVIGHFQEPGLLEIRGCLDIPVVGLGECNMLYACSLGSKIGLITINPIFIPWHQKQIANMGLQQRIVTVLAVDSQVIDYENGFKSSEKYTTVKNKYLEQIQKMISSDIEVIIPAGGLPMLLLASDEQINLPHGAIVQNGIAVCAQYTCMSLNLYKQAHMSVSRRATYRKASEDAIDKFLAITKK